MIIYQRKYIGTLFAFKAVGWQTYYGLFKTDRFWEFFILLRSVIALRNKGWNYLGVIGESLQTPQHQIIKRKQLQSKIKNEIFEFSKSGSANINAFPMRGQTFNGRDSMNVIGKQIKTFLFEMQKAVGAQEIVAG